MILDDGENLTLEELIILKAKGNLVFGQKRRFKSLFRLCINKEKEDVFKVFPVPILLSEDVSKGFLYYFFGAPTGEPVGSKIGNLLVTKGFTCWKIIIKLFNPRSYDF